MKRLTSLFTHTGLGTALILAAVVPALAQSTPTLRPNVVAPTPARPGPGQPGGQGQLPGQGQATPPAAAPRPEPRAPNIGGPNNQGMPSHTNIKLDLTITDTFTGSPVKKTVTMLVLQNNGGMIRTTSADGWATLNVDAVAAAYTSGQVSIRLTFEYTPALTRPVASTENISGSRPPRLNESITVVLQDGKQLMVSQSADPATERKVTAELTATILK